MATAPNDALIVLCPACATANRLPRERLAKGGICGRCKRPLFSGEPVKLTADNFDAHAARSDIPLLVDFWASWCGPCRQMAPAFSAAAGQLEPYMRLGKLDTEAHQAIAGRYAIRSNPALDEDVRASLVSDLMQARRAVRDARKNGDVSAEREAHAAVDIAKRGLGERGPVWWTDGAPDYNRHMARNTPYADWFAALD